MKWKPFSMRKSSLPHCTRNCTKWKQQMLELWRSAHGFYFQYEFRKVHFCVVRRKPSWGQNNIWSVNSQESRPLISFTAAKQKCSIIFWCESSKSKEITKILRIAWRNWKLTPSNAPMKREPSSKLRASLCCTLNRQSRWKWKKRICPMRKTYRKCIPNWPRRMWRNVWIRPSQF